MKRWVLFAALGLVACANQQARDYGEESNAQESARIHTELGAGYYAQNKMAIALDEFTHAAKADPSYAQAYNGLGLVYGALGEELRMKKGIHALAITSRTLGEWEASPEANVSPKCAGGSGK